MSEPAQEQLQPTRAVDWRRPLAEGVVELPSGNVAKLRRPQLVGMIRRGEIPNPLLPAAVDMLEGKRSADVQETTDFVFFLAQQAFVEPRVVKENPQEGEISYDDLSDADVEFVIAWANAPAAEAEPFRQLAAGDGRGGDGEDLRLSAVGDSRG